MTISFSSLGLSESLVNQLEKIGFVTPTKIQSLAIPELLSGRDVVGQSQTGTGKTAAYSLPILDSIDRSSKDVQALILTPTRELAQQVAESLKDFIARGDRTYVLTVYGGQSIERQIRFLEKGSHIVVGTPGRIIDLLNRKNLTLDSLRYAVLDEADEMLSMGFIDDVKEILSQTPKSRQTICFSATMPKEIQYLVKEFMNDPINATGEKPQDTPSRIDQCVYMVPRGWSKIKTIQPILEIEDPQSGIIFVRTKRTASELTTKLQEAGQSVDEYHGDLSQSQRERLIQRWRDGKIKLVVATDIAARGLDVSDLTHVFNFDLPDNTETYIHRIGRTGRAGKEGKAIALVEPSDRRFLRQIERRLNQTIRVENVPNRSTVEAKRMEKLTEQIKESLAGERLASFLPLVKELHEDYDPTAIAAATLQILYDRDCPSWLQQDWDVPPPATPKPYIKKGKGGRTKYGSRGADSFDRQNKYKGKPKRSYNRSVKLNNR
ncbi:DEAD/DEAH box helicase [Cyanobacterium aponinum UTEX 3222]|uniref:RNA helicase n=2 Tax=Cyanobacterium aponinum TaxID=379064 RepID=K9Z6S4_CYAAP|nr:DEAD/DEAH box helicase [Cyanobacterium aponinum]WRL43790.1 DEAD/DEAH box helicase [Cyanobacterium aponinum UTEX 3222]AFZ54255.1 DEAD/DEAH box helicase domain protein [Cyanobacterium aponinum PCC 10605]PHV64286.1 ATP-dependent helicase [Cyanobacterium aponinum IPPAS B-1201]WPF89081.1 DEAD/DEAH box helicase [Cyanobacterium aponinum AL20115]WRL37428.1 DEAD/DEAH box helicase [Cyanobacterium aponinum UTEX 3221]